MKKLLHHCAVKITRGSLSKVTEVFELLGCEVVYRPDVQTWAMVSQKGVNFNIQLVEYDDVPVSDIAVKQGTHVAFVSDDPKGMINEVKSWANKNGFTVRDGGWSDKELFFDLPELFISFVIEVMHTSIIE